MSQSVTKQDTISLKVAFLSILFITAIAAILLGVASLLNQQRREEVITRYTQETKAVFAEDDEIGKIFSQVMDDCHTQYLDNQKAKNLSNPSDITCSAAKDYLDSTGLIGRMQDGSATAYARIIDGQIELIEASGVYRGPRDLADYYYYRSQQARSDLKAFVLEHKQINLWQDFLSYIPGKEVAVIIDNDFDQTTIVFRGVIEK